MMPIVFLPSLRGITFSPFAYYCLLRTIAFIRAGGSGLRSALRAYDVKAVAVHHRF